MVLARGDNEIKYAETYFKFIEEIQKIYGSQRDYSPTQPKLNESDIGFQIAGSRNQSPNLQ